MVAALSDSSHSIADRATARAARSLQASTEARLDAALVQRFNAGDEPAFVEIVTRHRSRLRQVALGLLRNHADAEEIVQDTFIRAHRGLARFRGDSSLAAWLYRITVNLARNRYWYHYRRHRHEMLPLDATLGEGSTGTFAELVASAAPSPVREVMNGEFAAIVSACTEQLTPGQQEILLLRNVQHRSYHFIGRLLGIGPGTVKSRIARARASLRVLVARTYPEVRSEADRAGPFECVRASGQLEAACA